MRANRVQDLLSASPADTGSQAGEQKSPGGPSNPHPPCTNLTCLHAHPAHYGPTSTALPPLHQTLHTCRHTLSQTCTATHRHAQASAHTFGCTAGPLASM